MTLQDCDTALAAADPLPALVRMLAEGTQEERVAAAQALHALAKGSQARQSSIISAGAVPSLVTLLCADTLLPTSAQSPPLDQQLQKTVVMILQTLAAGSQQNADAILAAGAVPALRTLTGSALAVIQETARATLGSLASAVASK